MNVDERLSALSPEQRALLDKLRQKQAQAKPAARTPPPVQPVSGPTGVGDWPLSFDQERLWKMHQENPQLISWNVDAGSRIRGELDLALFLSAFHELIRRHAAWRTTFPLVDGRPVQRVHEWLEPSVSILDMSALPAELREETGHAAIYDHTRNIFDLENGPLVRIALVRIDEHDHLYLLTIHHTVTDWITFQIFFQELVQIYDAFRAGQPSPLPPLPIQYPDYAVWERERYQGELLEEEGRFWRQTLAGFPLVLDLPGSRPRPPVQSQRGGLVPVRAGAARTDRLRNLAHKEGATMFMGVLAVLDALFARVTGRDRIVLGSNSANRPRPELGPVAGLFLAQLPFATDVSGDPGFREVLARAKKTVLSVYAHQNLPFSKLLEILDVPPDRSRNPVVQALLLVLEGQSHSDSGELEFEATELYDGNSRWDLMFGLYDYHDLGLTGPVEYNADIFDETSVGRLVELFYRIIDAVTADPDLRLSQLPRLEEDLEGTAG